ncbi:MAG: peptide-methionine (S)-S-oxide reductase MsrA [Pseudomonadota bacterium]
MTTPQDRPSFSIAALVAGAAAAIAMFSSSAGAQDKNLEVTTVGNTDTAIFAGGCFWCVESDFDKVDGVIDTVSGYTGGETLNPTYKSHGKDGHLEAVKVTFDPEKVSYDMLVSYFFRHIDPTDAGGQFCDRGNSYTTAIFTSDDQQADAASAEKAAIERSGILPGPVVTTIQDAAPFYAAEDYHQDYYLKNPVRYNFYREACRRDATVKKVWSLEPKS